MTQTLGVFIDHSDVRPRPDATRPTRQEAIQAVRDELTGQGIRCDEQRAQDLVAMLERAAYLVRKKKYRRAYRLDEAELMRLHPMLEHIMPDDVSTPDPGSAHDVFQRYFLRNNEYALVHTREGHRMCVIAIALQAV